MSSFARPSAAIRIVAPSAPSSPASPAPSNANRDSQPFKKPVAKCRNILIHGYCKNEGKGCIYDHSDETSTPVSSSAQASSTSSATPVVSVVNVNAPVFVPKAPVAPAASVPSPDAFTPAYLRAPSTEIQEGETSETATALNTYDENADYSLSNGMNGLQLDESYNIMDPMQAQIFNPSNSYMDPRGYYPGMPNFVHQPLDYHLYTQLPYLPTGAIGKPATHRFFMSETLRQDLQRRSDAVHSTLPPPSVQLQHIPKPLPEELHVYHTLVPLEATDKDRRKWFLGCSSIVYKAINRVDGTPVVLRRIEGFRLTNEAAFESVSSWSSIAHPNIVGLREAFTSRAFGDFSLIFAFDYHPTAKTLYEQHLAPPDLHTNSIPSPSRSRGYRTHYKNRGGAGTGGSSGSGGVGELGGPLEERILWSYLVQIGNIMREVHSRGLALRTLDVSKVLVTGKNRIRFNCGGIFDVLTYDPRTPPNIPGLQQDDLLAFGKLVIALCTRNANAVNNLAKSLDTIQRTYSPDVKNIILFLISKPAPNKIIDSLLDMFGTRLLTEMNAMQSYADELEGEMMGELENGRLVRLMSKLGFINERPDFSHEIRWSETGDRYLVSLFRDYVFHQVDETGSPVVNLTHVITCLNKLDAGSEERIMLVSRDEQTCLVVSYKEIKVCIESAFSELARPIRQLYGGILR